MTARITTEDAIRASGGRALIGYLPVGFPDLATSIEAAVAIADAGCTAIELGVPYSDPGMDGPVIQAATQIQEMTLVFVPKMVAVFAGMVIFGAFMLDAIARFTFMIFDLISRSGGV